MISQLALFLLGHSLMLVGELGLLAESSRAGSGLVGAAPSTGQGTEIVLNGRTYPAAWAQWTSPSLPNQTIIGISDSGLSQRLGFDLQDTNTALQQPVSWFAPQPIPLATRFSQTGAFRYLEVSSLAQTLGWQLRPNGNKLFLTSPPAQVRSLRLGRQTWGTRIVLDLDQPTPWQLARLTNSRDGIANREFTVTLDAAAAAATVKRWTLPSGNALKSLEVKTQKGQTIVQGVMGGIFQPQMQMLTNPPRLVIDLQSTSFRSRDILWAPGLRWREQLVTLGQRQFPVIWLTIDSRQPNLSLKPIWGNPQALPGIQPLMAIASQSRSAAAINGGFFNRDNQTPLGAIRRDGQWISSPILGRGVVAWDAQGQLKLGRISLKSMITTQGGQQREIVSINSGYPQKGIAQYTPTWGAQYTSLLENEQIITVVENTVTTQQSSRSAKTFAIPANGYLLVLRSISLGSELAPGTPLQIQTTANPSSFEPFPSMMGAGPLLLANGRVVLNAKSEQFRPPFDTQAAPRSGIGQTAEGIILIAVVHNRIGGAGPTLSEWAQLMGQLGAVDALNLDGGSSTALYLGGQLLDRHPTTAARVQNGIGVFVHP